MAALERDDFAEEASGEWPLPREARLPASARAAAWGAALPLPFAFLPGAFGLRPRAAPASGHACA
jgi:hypothetical protein